MSKCIIIPMEELTKNSEENPEFNDFMQELAIAFAMAEKEHATCH